MAQYEELDIDQGSTFRYLVEIQTSAGSAYVFDGVTITGDIKKTYKSLTTAASFTCTSPQDGQILLFLTDEQTGAITAGRYVYDIYINPTSGTRYRVLEGILNVTPSVTQQ